LDEIADGHLLTVIHRDDNDTDRMTQVSESDAMRAYARIAANQEAEEQSFDPSSVMERLILQVLGCWANMLAEVNASRFSAAGPGADWVDESKLTKSVRKLAKESRVKWPQDKFVNAADHAGTVRHSMAHMLYINEIVGNGPTAHRPSPGLGCPDNPEKSRGARRNCRGVTRSGCNKRSDRMRSQRVTFARQSQRSSGS
jgi:hypothetical protein